MFRVLVRSITEDTVEIGVEGDLTLGPPTSQFRDVVVNLLARYREVTIDFSRMRRIDSTGVGVLIECHTSAHARGRRLRLANIVGRVREVLLLVRVLTLIEGDPTALAA